MSCDIENLQKQLLFLEQNKNFPKRRWVRSKNVFLSSGGLAASVVTENHVLRTSSDLSTWNNTCFSFKCRVTFQLRQTSKATFFVTLALYIWRLTCLAIPNTWEKTAFDFFGNVVFVVLDCVYFLKVSVQFFEKCRPMSPKRINIPLKMTLREAQSLRFKLCFACFSSCEWKSCCENFETNVCELMPIFVRLQCWLLRALVFEGHV